MNDQYGDIIEFIHALGGFLLIIVYFFIAIISFGTFIALIIFAAKAINEKYNK